MGFYDNFTTAPLDVLSEFNQLHGTSFDSITYFSDSSDLLYTQSFYSLGTVTKNPSNQGKAIFIIKASRRLIELGQDTYYPGHIPGITDRIFDVPQPDHVPYEIGGILDKFRIRASHVRELHTTSLLAQLASPVSSPLPH